MDLKNKQKYLNVIHQYIVLMGNVIKSKNMNRHNLQK